MHDMHFFVVKIVSSYTLELENIAQTLDLTRIMLMHFVNTF